MWQSQKKKKKKKKEGKHIGVQYLITTTKLASFFKHFKTTMISFLKKKDHHLANFERVRGQKPDLTLWRWRLAKVLTLMLPPLGNISVNNWWCMHRAFYRPTVPETPICICSILSYSLMYFCRWSLLKQNVFLLSSFDKFSESSHVEHESTLCLRNLDRNLPCYKTVTPFLCHRSQWQNLSEH